MKVQMIVTCIKIGLFLVSGFGYWEYFRSKHGIHIYFAPVFTLAVQFCILFAAGLLNCLGEAALVLYGVGFLLFLREAYQKRLRLFSPYWNPGYLYLALALFGVGIMVQGKLFTQIDNFTHWATVVRNMLSTDRFPSFKEPVIEFISYPLGSSALIYFVCKMIGEAESMQMWAQAYVMLCTLLPVFSCCQKNKGAFWGLTVVMTGFLLNYNIPVTELLVDTLMPLVGMATALFVYGHCSEKDGKMAFSPYYAIPLLIWTMNIKHAALIFVVLSLVLLYLYVGKQERDRKQWALVAGSVLLANVLWSRHCDYVFAGASGSRHSLSLGWFRTILGEKTLEGILETVKMVLVRLATRTECLWLMVWIFLLGILVWFGIREERKRYIRLLLCGVCLYGVYAIGIGAMYVFSMEDYGELLAFTRYMRSIDVAIYYMLTAYSGVLLSKLVKPQCAAGIGVALALLTAAGWYWQTGEYLKEPLACCSVEWRQELEHPIAKYDIQPGKTYLLCIRGDYHGWPRRIWRYNLKSVAVDQIVVTDADQLQIEKNYDYVVFLDWGNPVIEEWIQENYPDAIGSQVIEHLICSAE